MRSLHQSTRAGLLALVATSIAAAQPTSVEHSPFDPTFGEPVGITQREPDTPREDDQVTLFVRVSFQFTYDRVALYYTTDGSQPSGTFGAGQGSTQVLSNTGGQIVFVRNEGNRDWWSVVLPIGTRGFAQTIRYKIGAWSTGGGAEVVADNGGTSYTFVNKLAWPGAGAGSPTPSAGYPPVSFWKEEAMVGNNYYNAMIDQNGTIFDIFYPGAGAVQGVGTKNEGYVDGGDTFPAFTSGRGQMHVNQYMAGLRVDGLTYWMSNQNGLGYTDIAQAYHPTSNTVNSNRRLNAAGNNISIQQIDFAPKLEAGPLGYPLYVDGVQKPNRGLHVERFVLTNNGPLAKTVNFYYYGDWAINGGDGSDASYYDTIAINGSPINAMIAYDNAGGTAVSRGEYNPTSTSDNNNYSKDVSIFLGAAMKLCTAVGGSGGSPATDGWKDTSTDAGQGWIGRQITLQPGVPVEIDVLIAGGFKPTAGVGDVGDVQIRPAFSWFLNNSMQSLQAQTDQWWTDWLSTGVTVDTPDDDYDKLFKRGLLASALHIDGQSGALVAGYHNGAYPFCWPRDAVYGAVCMARTGHIAESAGVYQWMRDVCFRGNESWGKGFWKQKYTTDGYVVWSAPQIDETAVFPWGVYYHWQATGDNAFLASHYNTVREAAYTISSNPGDSNLLPFLNYNATERLMWSNNVWEDSYGFFIYSNANVVRGLRDAAAIATAQGNGGDAADFTNRANTIQSGLDDKLNANGEITDISQLGIVYPFRVYLPTDSKAVRYIDRINGVQNDTSGNSHPLMNFTNRYHWQDLINRYWGDGYWGNGSASSPWGAGPWFLSTMWYGLYYAERADYTANKADIDNHKYRMDLLIDRLGPAGFGAEQIAPHCSDSCPAGDCPDCGSLTYLGQTDFVLQTAWPNAWESMSTFVDAIMAFLDYHPDAINDSFRVDPKLPTGWGTMTFNNLYLRGKRFNVRCDESPGINSITFTNVSGGALNFGASIRVPAGSNVLTTTLDCNPIAYSYASNIGRVLTQTNQPLGSAANTVNTLRVYFGLRGDLDHNGSVQVADIPLMVNLLLGIDPDCIARPIADMDGNGQLNGADLALFIDAILP
jgi:GH15 family glucan-1,4-alpha-glucosidase